MGKYVALAEIQIETGEAALAKEFLDQAEKVAEIGD